jgi:hypothetical protein
MDQADLEQYCKNAPVNTDDKPLVEYSQEMDLKPNLEVLADMAASDYHINKNLDLIASNGRSKEHISKHIQNYNKIYRDQLIQFIKGFKSEE